MKEEKSDVLIMIIGTSPMPNLITACTRVKEDGYIYMIYTSKTSNVRKKLKELIETKTNRKMSNKIKCHEVSINTNTDNVKNDLNNILDKLILDIGEDELKDMTVELNYTGGTKVLSSIMYYLVKDKLKDIAKNVLRTYLDGEKALVVLQDVSSNKEKTIPYSKLKDNYSVDIYDIFTLHDSKNNNVSFNHIDDLDISKFNYDIYNKVLLSNDKDKINIYKNQVLKITGNNHSKNNISQVLNNILDSCGLRSITYPDSASILVDYKKIYGEYYLDNIVYDLRGLWLEYGLLNYLNNIKDEIEIDEVVNSIKTYRKGSLDSVYEVDLAVLRKHILYIISITTSRNLDLCLHKLYEVKLRAEQIGGNNVRVGFVSLHNNGEKLKSAFKDVWDGDLKSTLIISQDNMDNIEDSLKQWILNGGKSIGK